ncbi:MAG: hydrogenase formation protein HypD [Candidatus Marinimicrobia bacterium]|nr:hydrogenase formation protein HypD [Candidatus Neomarinimicrobiota bacterium]
MNYIQEFRNPEISKIILHQIEEVSAQLERKINIMEICGGHTYAIFRFGINNVLPENINLISGPGCPVCVTSQSFIDEAIEYAKLPNVTLCTFGDLVRVPGSYSSLSREKSEGASIEICYSPMESLSLAMNSPGQEIIFLGIGFETTAPLTAALVLEAKSRGITNLSVLSAHKTMPRALYALLNSEMVKVDGLICPGHVSSVTGYSIYSEIVDNLQIPAVICGFEPNDILQTILMLVQQIRSDKAKIENQYSRGVKKEGNILAQKMMNRVFMPVTSYWRGIGNIPASGLEVAEEFNSFNARQKNSVAVPPERIIKGCICGEIMQGVKKPTDCQLFGTVCTPQDPQGACMVSSEGGCATYYKFRE